MCIFSAIPIWTTPVTDNLVIALADGRVLSTGSAEVPADLDLPAGEWRRIAIFMNVFDVHVNRAPVAGKVTATSYHAGQFVNASLDKASEANERQNVVMEMEGGQQVGIVQIAGLVARRILLEAGVGDELAIGQQFGIIRFGSRVDLWIPASTPVLVMPGQRTVAGETVLADLGATLQELVDSGKHDGDRPEKQRRFRSVSLFWLIPNIITVAGLISWFNGTPVCLDGRWSMVIGLITLAAVFDALDGRAARRFKTSSKFGAALDSLSDMVVFGVVPSLCLYLWALQDSGNLAWWATMFYAVAIALRLARFDSELREPE